MITLTKNNYLRYSGSGETFKVDVDKLPVANNYYKESIIAAEEIYSLKQGKLNILYSGGVDSEYVLSLFLELGMEIHPVIIKLGNYNNHDLDYAFKFCNSKNLTPTVLDIDFDNFVRTGKMLEVAIETKSSVYHRSATCYAFSKIDGTVLLGGGDLYMRPDSNMTWNLEHYEHDFAGWNYFQKYGIYGTTNFLRYTPEMFSAYVTDSRFQELSQNLHPGKLGSNSSKIYVMNRHSPFKLEERTKYHGYENIEKSDIFNHEDFKTLTELGNSYNGLVSLNYQEFIKQNIE